MAKPAQLVLHADLVDNGTSFKEQLEDEHGQSKEDEEEEETFCRRAESVAAASFGGQLASLDHQNARVQEDEGQVQQCCKRSVVLTASGAQGAETCSQHIHSTMCTVPYHTAPFEDPGGGLFQWREAKIQPKEGNADEEGHNHTGLFGLSADQQNPARDHQLAAHLERLPPEGLGRIVRPKECRHTREARWNVRGYCRATRPEQQGVDQGDAHGPHGQECKRCQAGPRVLVRVAIERQVGGKVAPRIATAVLERFAEERLEDSRRRTRQHEEREGEH